MDMCVFPGYRITAPLDYSGGNESSCQHLIRVGVAKYTRHPARRIRFRAIRNLKQAAMSPSSSYLYVVRP